MRPTLMRGVLAVVIGTFVLGGSMVARQSRQEPDVTGALLIEVRGLRAAIEQLAATGPRVQLALGRLQMHEQRIDTLVKRHSEVRDRRLEVEAELARHKNTIGSLEETIRTTTNVLPRDEITEAIRHHRRLVSETSERLQRLVAEEAAIAQDVSGEQTQWSDVSRRLDELDRALNRK
jgi:paraquat-inducible protein B